MPDPSSQVEITSPWPQHRKQCREKCRELYWHLTEPTTTASLAKVLRSRAGPRHCARESVRVTRRHNTQDERQQMPCGFSNAPYQLAESTLYFKQAHISGKPHFVSEGRFQNTREYYTSFEKGIVYKLYADACIHVRAHAHPAQFALEFSEKTSIPGLVTAGHSQSSLQPR